ncbi:RNA polymerase sigma factor [Pedobacter sp. SYP-B3415]|uniref:RNA polymerase sigma factor n=1 Tax=Pedobacter sp. SYP-B3415 TaxID=2496641 RepID=UPI001F11571F|nr:DUF6596 domain-containing protein [Pedobacter sp. SYP-B3415]
MNTALLPHLFREEYAKMTAFLCRHFGLRNLEAAEDIAADTFLKASEHWALNGTPANPVGWLYTVASNKAKDEFRHLHVFNAKVKMNLGGSAWDNTFQFEFDTKIIEDSQLAMIFAVCNPSNAVTAQIALALQILCGFSIEEIASACLIKKETVKKQLYRARIRLRESNFDIASLEEFAIHSRLPTVLRTLYLLFNEGYASTTNSRQIRKDVCADAIRLALLLTENRFTNTPAVNALLALMCYQSSRLDARENDEGDAVLYESQDRSLWNQQLIDQGNHYLINATGGSEISKYHLEAGIAYWHTAQSGDDKWQQILSLYDRLILMDGSPATAMNRLFAVAKVYGTIEALAETEKIKLPHDSYYHQLLGYLHADSDSAKAIEHYVRAIELTASLPQKQQLLKAISMLESNAGKAKNRKDIDKTAPKPEAR